MICSSRNKNKYEAVSKVQTDKLVPSMLKLILCASYAEVMKSLLDEQNPLYGRFGLVLHLKAMEPVSKVCYF